MDLETKRQEQIAQDFNVESSETFEFEFDSNMNMINTPSSETPEVVAAPEVATTETPAPVTESIDDITEVENKKRVPTESIEMNFDGSEDAPEAVAEESQDEGFKFDDGVSDEPEKVDEVPELDDLQKALKRIEELENNQNKAMSDAEFDATYSKETMVMPNISEHEYASLGKELASGELSKETYDSLSEKGYSKEVVDNHIKQTLAQIEGQIPAPVAEPTQEVVKSNFAKELGMEVSGLESLLTDVKNVLTETQIARFDNSTPQEQANTLLKFQNQKLLHAQKVAGKKLMKGSNVKPATKNPIDNITVEQAEANFNKAIMSSDYAVADKWGKVLEAKGVKSSF